MSGGGAAVGAALRARQSWTARSIVSTARPMSAEARGRTPGSFGSACWRRPKASRPFMPWVETMRSGLQRKDVAPQALEIVFERIGLRSGVDDFDRSAA